MNINLNNIVIKILICLKQIHPEASRDQDVITVCNNMEGDKWEILTPETILPEVDDFEPEGKKQNL